MMEKDACKQDFYQNEYDLVLVDWECCPYKDGVQIIQECRNNGYI